METNPVITSVLSYPDRGPWGKSSWRGNTSGYIYRDLFQQYNPKLFVDPMVGSGTSIEVANEMGIEAVGLDLHSGFNILRDSILERVGRPADLVFSHPPYGSMVIYSGQVWGNKAHPDDLSRCVSDDDFNEKMALALLNQREATSPSGFYGMLIGDLRKAGKYSCYAAEMMARMPKSELVCVLIKQQHNCVSDRREYAHMKHPRIMHEYLVLWERPKAIMVSLLESLNVMACQQASNLRSVWRVIVRMAMMSSNGKPMALKDIYANVEAAAPERLASNEHWKAKVRQVLQLDPSFRNIERGTWALA